MPERLEDLGLHPQTLWVLQCHKLTVEELRNLPDRRLLLLEDVGAGRVAEIREAFAIREADAAPRPWWLQPLP